MILILDEEGEHIATGVAEGKQCPQCNATNTITKTKCINCGASL